MSPIILQPLCWVEGGYIEYGNIEKCSGWLNRNHSDGNIEFNFQNGNIDSKTGSNGGSNGVPRGWGGWGGDR